MNNVNIPNLWKYLCSPKNIMYETELLISKSRELHKKITNMSAQDSQIIIKSLIKNKQLQENKINGILEKNATIKASKTNNTDIKITKPVYLNLINRIKIHTGRLTLEQEYFKKSNCAIVDLIYLAKLREQYANYL